MEPIVQVLIGCASLHQVGLDLWYSYVKFARSISVSATPAFSQARGWTRVCILDRGMRRSSRNQAWLSKTERWSPPRYFFQVGGNLTNLRRCYCKDFLFYNNITNWVFDWMVGAVTSCRDGLSTGGHVSLTPSLLWLVSGQQKIGIFRCVCMSGVFRCGCSQLLTISWRLHAKKGYVAAIALTVQKLWVN